jgi:hypothetical protein
MAVPVRTYGDGILIIDGDFVRGEDAVAASGLSGSVLNLRGGNGDGVGDAGGVLIDGGAPGASSGADGGSVTLQATDSAAAGAGLAGNVVLIPGLGLGVGATDGLVRIDSSAPDTSPLLQFDNSGGTNGVVTDMLAGDQDPSVALISARKGSIYIRNAAGATVGSVWVNTSTTDPGTTWTDITAGGGSTWAAVLAAGPTSGGTSPIISAGDNIIGVDTSGSNASDYTVRAGNHTAGTGSFTGGDLTVSGGSNASSSNGARGGHLVVAGGDNLVATGATGGDLTCRAGAGGIGGEAIFAGGEGIAGNAGGAATFQGGDNTDTGRGGNTVVRGGDCIAGSGSDAGGTLLIRGGTARGTGAAGLLTIRGGQPGGTTSPTSAIEINTDITVAGTNRETGDINLGTGNTARNSSLGKSGDIRAVTGDNTGTGASGFILIETGTSAANVTGDITLQTGNTASGLANDPAGDINLITGDRTNTGSDGGSRAGDVNIILGTSSNPNTTGPGGSLVVLGGPSDAASANGRGGSISLTGGVYSGGVANGLAGGVTVTGGSSTGAFGNGGGVTIAGGQGSGANALPGDVSVTGGAGDGLDSGARGGDVTVSGGAGGSTGRGGNLILSAGAAGTSNSNGGSVTITATAATGVGADAGIALQATRSGTDDDAVVSIDTENGSFSGSEWNHMTVGVDAAASAGTTTALAISGPSVNGENMKLRVWVTASDNVTPAAQLSQILERSFIRSGGATTAFSADHQNNIINDGGWAIGDVVTTSFSGTTINVLITTPSTGSRWMMQVAWQVGGMAA